MDKANKLLYDYYDRSIEQDGRDEAARKLRQVVVLGVHILLETPEAAHSPKVRRVFEHVQGGREEDFAEHMAVLVQDTHKAFEKKFIAGVKLSQQEIILPFLSDVDIPNTRQNVSRWRNFLDRISPRNRLGQDPVTRIAGRIPYRNGVWLSDLVFQAGAEPCPPPEIHTIHGELVCSAKRHRIATPLTIEGDLHLLLDMLGISESPVKQLKGALHINAPVRKHLKFAGNLPLGPETLMAWGLRPGAQLVLGDHGRYVLQAKQHEGDIVHTLAEVLDPASTRRTVSMRYLWDKSAAAWRELSSQLPMDTLNAVRVKLNNLAHALGLGPEFLRDHTDSIQENIRNLLIFFDICLGVYTRGRGSPLRGGDEPTVAAMADALSGLARLCQADALEDEMAVRKRVEKIHRQLDAISEDRLQELKDIFLEPLPAMNLKKIRWDLQYLGKLLTEQLELEDVLTSAGKTLVFLNNTFLSKEAKTKAARLIGGLRRILRQIVTPGEVDPMLIALLKARDDSLLKALRASHPDEEKHLEELAAKLNILDMPTAPKIVEKFDTAPEESDSPEMLVDKDFLHKCREFHRASLDELFRWIKDDGEPYYDMERLRQALLVNMESYAADSLRKGLKEFEGQRPSEVARTVFDSLSQVEPVMAAYNRVMARTAG